MFKKIVFVSPFHFGYEHLIFEVSIMRYYLFFYPDYTFEYIAQKQHGDHILKYLDTEKIYFKAINSNNRNILTFSTFFSVLFKRNCTVIYLSVNPFYLFFLIIFAKVDVAFMHNYWRETSSFLGKFLHYFGLSLFLTFHKKIKIFVLGPWIHKNIMKDLFLSQMAKNLFFWINHPYFLSKNPSSTIKNNKIIFGFLGRQKFTHKKISQDFLIKIQDEIVKKGADFIQSNQSDLTNPYEYQKILDKSDYVVILSPEDSYNYRCSGVFIDAIVNGKPIVCLSNDMTDYFFNQFGDIGYKFDSMDELLANIMNMIGDFDLSYESKSRLIASHSYLFTDMVNFTEKLSIH